MVESNGKHYVGGKVQMIDNCDPDRWSKLEVDDVLVKLAIDVSKLEYYYLNPGMRLDDGLARLFDNLSAVEMAEIEVQKGVVDVYAVEANEVVESQTTQEIDVGGVSRLDDIGVGTMGGESEGGESGVGDRVHSDFEGCESGKGGEYEGGEIGVGDNQVGKVKGKETEKAKASGKGKGKEKEKAKASVKGKGKEKEKTTGKGKGIDGVRSIVAEDDPAKDPSFIDSD